MKVFESEEVFEVHFGEFPLLLVFVVLIQFVVEKDVRLEVFGEELKVGFKVVDDLGNRREVDVLGF